MWTWAAIDYTIRRREKTETYLQGQASMHACDLTSAPLRTRAVEHWSQTADFTAKIIRAKAILSLARGAHTVKAKSKNSTALGIILLCVLTC